MKNWWRRWTYEVPLFISDALRDVLVVQLAAWLDRLTLRQIIAFIPCVILVLAYAHNIPIPPELMLVGDLLAYIDIFSVILLLSMLSRAAAICFVVKQATLPAIAFVRSLFTGARLGASHQRERGAKGRKWLFGHAEDDDGCIAMLSAAVA